ncbi:MAG: vWA domain-containing protein, partial [Planctomycetota bacterium]
MSATCRCGAGELEIVFVVDATSSMWPVIGTMKAQAERIVQILEGHIETLRVGAVAFRTRADPDMGRPKVLDLTSDRKKLSKWFGGIKALRGGEEAVADALKAALKQVSWSPRARKVIVLIGDEGPLLEPGLPLAAARLSKHAGAEGRQMLDLASEATSRGIVVNTITASKTAWIYYMGWLR